MRSSATHAYARCGALACALAFVLALALVALAPVAGATARRAPSGATARVARPTVPGALQSLQRSGALNVSAAAQYEATYRHAGALLKKLSGTRREELASVLSNVQQIAGGGQFIASRLPALFLTLERNVQWWGSEPLLAADQRVSFAGSRIVWEHYPGQGIEIQWLATFGEANGYYLEGHENTQLQEVLNEVIPLATQRAGGIAWEYMFHFDGGAPPWTSGLSQGTALQALARAYSRLKNPAYLAAAQQALKLFQSPPPAGVRVATPAGATYLEYTYAPQERIINGFIQALNGLYDYAKLTGDPAGARLFEEGDAEARGELPHYDTGAWSMYDQHVESNLNYHELLTEFLQDLCKRTEEGPPLPAAAQTPPSSSPSSSSSSSENPSGGTAGSTAGSTGGSAPAGATAASASAAHTPLRTAIARAGAVTVQPSKQIPGDAIYCTTAQRFGEDLHTPPTIALLTRTLPSGARGGVALSLSKVATVSLNVSRGGHVVWTNSALVERGDPRLLWITPSKPGSYSITLRAVDLAGNSATASGTIAVTMPPRARHAR